MRYSVLRLCSAGESVPKLVLALSALLASASERFVRFVRDVSEVF